MRNRRRSRVRKGGGGSSVALDAISKLEKREEGKEKRGGP
jgi:hypothetical protein